MTPGKSNIFEQVVNYFADDEWDFSQIENQQKLVIEYKNGQGYEWQIVAKVEEGITSAKIIFSSRIPESASIGGAYFNRVGEFFHRINSSQIEVGNFELDYNRGLAYCRTSIKINPMIINSEEVIEYLINDLLYDNIRLMNQYLDGIKAVAQGKLDPEEAQMRGRVGYY